MKVFFLALLLTGGQVFISFCSELPKDVLFAKADSLFDAGDHAAANTILENFIAKNLSQAKIDYPSIAQAYNRKGLLLRLAGSNHKANEQIYESLKYAQLANDSMEIANAYREMGYNYIILGQYQEGLDAYNNALQIDERLNDNQNVAIDLNAIGKIYEMWRMFDQALEFFFKSLDIAQGLNNLDQVAVRMGSIASVYKSQQKFELALDWLQKSLAIEVELGNTVRRGYRLDQIGEIYTMIGKYAQAEDYLHQALSIFKENRVLVSESIVLNHLALNYFKKGDVKSAAIYYTQSLEIAKRVGFSNMILKNYQELSQLYEQSGDLAKALEHYKRFFVLKDSVYNERAQRQLMDFQVKYETEQKEKELALLNQEKLVQELKLNQANQQRLVMIGFSLVLLILLGSLFSRYNIKKKTQKQLTEINARLNDLNNTKDKLFSVVAHDLKNSIAGFSSIVETLNKKYDNISTDNIKHYLGELALSANSLKGMLKNLLEWARSQQNNVVVKFETLAITQVVEEAVSQTMPVANQKDITINKQFSCSPAIESDQNILATVLRNLLSNAVKYSNNGESIDISVKQNNNHIEIMVSDKGIGMSEEEVKTILNTKCHTESKPGVDGEKGSGLGLMLCKDLLQRISGNLIVQSEPGKGSQFTMLIPYNSENEN